MGRHSAADEDEDAAAAAIAGPPVGRPTPRGRHAQPETERADIAAEGADAPDAVQAAEAPAPDSAAAPRPELSAGKRAAQSSAADLALLRSHSDVRARCVAAVVVPFVLYSAIMYLIDALDLYLLWVWIPLVLAGVLAGSILDSAHRRYASFPQGSGSSDL